MKSCMHGLLTKEGKREEMRCSTKGGGQVVSEVF